MPAKSGNSSVLAQLGEKGRKAVRDHRGDETRYSTGGELPEGIEGGIAKLVDCKFGEIKAEGPNKGKPNFYAAGVVVLPEVHNNQKIVGLRTSISVNLVDSGTKTVQDKLDQVLNEFRKLGVDTESLELDDLETTAAALVKAAPMFKFRTWKGKKQTTGPYANQEPRVQHDWGGLAEYTESAKSSGVEDSTGSEPEPEPEPKPEPEPTEDLDALAKEADGGDKDSAKKLTKIAQEAGVSDDDIEGAKNWKAVVNMINDAEPAAVEKDTTEKTAPKKGDVYLYKPAKAKKAVECKVVSVDTDDNTVNLKNLDDDSVYKSISWDDLEEPS